MARKLERSERFEDDDGPLVGRRGYVKLGMLSTLLGGSLMGVTTNATAEGTHTLHIVGDGSLATYDLTVSGRLSDDGSLAFDAAKNISGRNAEGAVRDAVHGYRFHGEVVDVRVAGDAEVYLDGQPLEPESRIP